MFVEKTYWDGEHTGYRWEETHVPLAPGNSHFEQIKKSIADGTCDVREPSLGAVTQTVDRHGEPSGYRTPFGFVSMKQPSSLLALIKAQAKDGRCTIVEDVKSTNTGPIFEKLVLSIVLPQPWSDVNGDCSGELPYRSNPAGPERTYRFILRNLPAKQDDRVAMLLASKGVAFRSALDFSPHQFGVLDVELPVSGLRALYRGERKANLDDMLLKTLVKQHLAETGRSDPDINWLIQAAELYTTHFAVEFPNRIIDAFHLEYGQVPVRYLVEGGNRIQPVIFGCEANGTCHLISLGHQSHGGIEVPAEWHSSSLRRFNEEAQSSSFLLRTALRRVAALVILGFHLEALAPLNAFLEVAVLETLTRSVMADQTLASHIERMGHGERLAALMAGADLAQACYPCDESFKEFMRAAKEIYRIRNAYVHSLQAGDGVGRPTLLDRRKLESLFNCFVAPFEQQQLFMRLNSIALDSGRFQAIIRAYVSAHRTRTLGVN